VYHPREFEGAFEAATREGAGALLVQSALLFTPHQSQLAALAATHWLPAIYWARSFATAGGLLAYGPSMADLDRRAASYVDRLLKGAKPADLPVERPMTFELVINLKTAEALGLTIPPTRLFPATEVLRSAGRHSWQPKVGFRAHRSKGCSDAGRGRAGGHVRRTLGI
jgi:putative tryptophan/tyrosine transport system substrate-binding protein